MPLPIYSEPSKQAIKSIRHTIGIAAGKGGVGKSTLTANLALALKKLSFSVGVLDADLYGPSLRKMLPEETFPSQQNSSFQPAMAHGIKLMSMAYFKKERDAAVIRAPIANKLISQFANQVEWGSLDYLLIDFPPGTGDIQLSLSQTGQLNGAILVTTPQEIALLDVRKTLHMFEQLNVPILGVLENMSYYRDANQQPIALFGEGGGQKIAEEYRIPFLGRLPLDPMLCNLSDKGLSLFDADAAAERESTQALLHLARQLPELLVKAQATSQLQLVKLTPLNRTDFTLLWSDGKETRHRLYELQKLCPCAACTDENSGERIPKKEPLDPGVQADSIQLVGRYGIKIAFTSGCSNGIYTFENLRKIG